MKADNTIFSKGNLSVAFLLFVFVFSKIVVVTNAHQDQIVDSVLDLEDDQLLRRRLDDAKLDLWARGTSVNLDETLWFGNNLQDQVVGMETWQSQAARQGPIRKARYASYQHNKKTKPRQKQKQQLANKNDMMLSWISILHGGGDNVISSSSTAAAMKTKIQQLTQHYGSAFAQAIEQNQQEHDRDCQESCRYFYCAPAGTLSPNNNNNGSAQNQTLADVLGTNETTIRSYSMGAVPPEDFADEFGFPLDLIKVTQGQPLFSRDDAKHVIDIAESEGLSSNEYVSGKYKLGGDWLTKLPQTRQWFNEKLEKTLFPLLAFLFPEIVSHPSVLRAHSVSLLKYNASHPRTDVHIDNGILAMTLAMTPQDEYQGGGTFFEHFAVTSSNGHNDTTSMDSTILPMDVGHATLRPGSVRHGGHRVTHGTRYILGAFLLIEDRVEHVRRLKNRGSDLRSAGNLGAAAQHFEWALALNPKCTTCLKDWAEILHKQQRYTEAEAKIRQSLELLEYKDSDALFTLGMLLSEQGKDQECMDAYRQSLALNSEDAELLYNLGVKIGEQPNNGDRNEEISMYKRCIELDPIGFGGAWLNLGTILAEDGNLDDAETMFIKALGSSKPLEVKPKAMINLALIYHNKVGQAFQQQDIDAAKAAVLQAGSYLDSAKPLLDQVSSFESGMQQYQSQYNTLRLACHRNLGQIYAGTGDLAMCEEEFRRATDAFPTEIQAWQMLGRVLEIQGKKEAMQDVISKIQQLQSIKGGGF
ncbi:serine/threonine protein kinase [Nitzschia inconspicua]|uniref:Serine/threonine protein kinase n=1 Tax=Nitzschia inconspicua TaxID=303405 RepID=A0A9K3L484_9STRA|nr:serine/threonine protein kinase [Nitzschia inconspicua]